MRLWSLFLFCAKIFSVPKQLSGRDLKLLRLSNSRFNGISSERLFQVFLIDLSILEECLSKLEDIPTDQTLTDSVVLKLPRTLRICSSLPYGCHDYDALFRLWRWKGLVQLVQSMSNLRTIELSIAGFENGIPSDGVGEFLGRICGLHHKANVDLSITNLHGYRSGTLVRFLSNLRVLSLSTLEYDSPQMAKQMALALQRCPQLESLALAGRRRSLDDVLDYIEEPLSMLRELALTIIEPPCELHNLAKLPSLRKLVLNQTMCWNSHVRQNIWSSLRFADIYLEHITLEIPNLSFFDYLISHGENIKTLKVYLPSSPLHLEPVDAGGQSDEMIEYTIEDLAEVFWGSVLPAVMPSIESLTLYLQTANMRDFRIHGNDWSHKSHLLRLWTPQYVESRGFIHLLKATNLKSLTLMATVDDDLDKGWLNSTFRAIAILAGNSKHVIRVNLHLLHSNGKRFEKDVQRVRKDTLDWRCTKDVSLRDGIELVLISRFYACSSEKSLWSNELKAIRNAKYAPIYITFYSRSNRWVIEPNGKPTEAFRPYTHPLFSEHVFHF